jgi:ankyrin repeat protein
VVFVLLLLFFAPVPEPPVIQAVRSGNPAVLKQLIDPKEGLQAVGSHGQTALHEAASRCSIWAADMLVKAGLDRQVRDKEGQTAAMVASDCPPSTDRVSLIRVLMAAIPRDAGNQEGSRWSLQDAVARGDLNVASMLLQMGSAVNAVGDQGNRALEIAVRKGNLRATTFLLEHGADVQLKTTAGTTLMHEAALGGSAEIIAVIAGRGVDVNIPDKESEQTPLHYAASFDRPDAVEALLKAGADTKRRDRKGRTALDLAKAENHDRIVKLLQSR